MKNLRDKIISSKLKEVQVFIEEWETTVTIREMNGTSFVQAGENATTGIGIDRTKFLEQAIILSVFDEDGEPVFESGDAELISNLPAGIYSKLITAITTLNNITGASNSKN